MSKGNPPVEAMVKLRGTMRGTIKKIDERVGARMNQGTAEEDNMKNSAEWNGPCFSPFSVSPRAFSFLVMIFIFMSVLTTRAQQYSRGVGRYPGDPREDFSPAMQIDPIHHRNLALHRAAYQSGSYDYNLTAQLITDGIIDSQVPGWIVTTASTGGILQRNEREWVLDRHPMTRKTLEGPSAWLQTEMAGSYAVPAVDSINVSGNLLTDSLQPKHWELSVSGSGDGVKWNTLGTISGDQLPGDTLTGFFRRFFPPNLRAFSYPFRLDTIVHYKCYRVDVNSPNAIRWGIGEFGMCRNGKRATVGGPYHFASAWKSDGNKEEWVYVDLGAECSFDRIVLHWVLRAVAGSVQASDDATTWKEIAALSDNAANADDIKLAKQARGRYVRVLMTKPASTDGYILSELEVYGTGGLVAVPHSQAAMSKNGRMDLAGGAWRLQRASLVHADGSTMSTSGFDDGDWLIATVPATILVSYLNDGALPDPNIGDNQLLISDSFFYSDFWYRDVFTAPLSFKGKQIHLSFDGINWKAEVYLNGHTLGRIEGAFMRGVFDVTGILIPGGKNVLAVRIKRNDTPGFATEQTLYSPDANGGELGADNPTFHASIGWDWIPTIRGRNTGIWNDVYLSESGPVTIEDPFVSTDLPLPDTSSADISIQVTLCNHSNRRVEGILRGTFGKAAFKRPVRVEASETKTVTLHPSTHPSLRLHNPKLWWPNGYGRQNLYNVELGFFTQDGYRSDSRSFRTGIREMSYSEKGGALRIWVNGRRFIARGGNWGFSESMLRYRSREYDIAVHYHKDMNFTMIRNWVGQTVDDAFYDACDRYGIMVWQDFWLANPLDGPNPNDEGMFMQNAEDVVKRIRNHPSLALYVGRNEGNPPSGIDAALRKILPQLHPGVHYIPNSAFGVVSGGGPYRLMPAKFYFERRATEKLQSEMGMPDVVSYESLNQMIPASDMWPQGRLWGIHDFTLEGAQNGASFDKAIEEYFGKVDSLHKWLLCAQWVNYQGYRAMFEAQSKNRMGLLIWMSHPAWPSLVWQTYDYYFEPTAAYFACKKACEPLHIQWNPLSDSIEVVNYSLPDGSGLSAMMEILNLDGTVQSKQEAVVDCPEDSTIHCFPVEYPQGLPRVYVLRLRLKRGEKVMSENSYWRGLEEGNLKAIGKPLRVKLDSDTRVLKKGGSWYLTTTVTNATKHPAIMARVKLVGAASGKRILPALYSDNYVSLMPGEQRTIKIECQNSDTGGEKPDVTVEGLVIE